MQSRIQLSSGRNVERTRPQGPTVLLVETMPRILELYSKALLDAGYRVLRSRGSAGAQRLAQTNVPIDLLFADCRRASMDGLSLAKWFRSCRPDVPVVIVSASPMCVARVNRVHPRIPAYFQPSSPAELLVIVGTAVARRRQETA